MPRCRRGPESAGAGSGGQAPFEIPRAGWRDVLLRLKDAIREDRITLIAAGVACYAMLALLPAMIVVVSTYGLVLDPEQLAAQVRALGVLPGDVRSILTGQLDALARAPMWPWCFRMLPTLRPAEVARLVGSGAVGQGLAPDEADER